MTTMHQIMTQAVERRQRAWERDRTETVGGSEVGQCLRKTYYSKNEYKPDPDYADSWGARERGNLIENHHWEPALREWVDGQEGLSLMLAGDEQETLVDGYLSVTPDGLIINEGEEPVEALGLIIAPGEAIALECKSIDPRVDLKEAKDEHIFQTHIQMGLLRKTFPNLKIERAHITYTDASFLDTIHEFVVEFDEEVYNAGRSRAYQVMSADDPLMLPGEGKIAGGKECNYCPFRSQCAGDVAFSVPDGEAEVDEQAMQRLEFLVQSHAKMKEAEAAAKSERAEIEEQIKAMLREHNTKRVKTDTISVSYSSVKGRTSVDVKAAQADGVDLPKYQKQGDPSDRLTIKVL